MEGTSETIVPVGTIATVFGVISILVFFRKANIAKRSEKSIKNRMQAIRNEKNESLEEQKNRLEQLLRK